MKTIDAIVIHCTATRAGQDIHASDIDKWHKERGFAGIGYNYVIRLDGTIEQGRPLTRDGAHCNTAGLSGVSYNKHSIGIVYVGGLDENGNAADTRTPEQKKALAELVYRLMDEYPTIKEVIGHRDASPDKNGDGKISKNEWIKQCPCFSVRDEFPMAICTAKRK
ncbi:MAG: N-acetylmuramoyl-L-alanine amidase [Alphaproteobacteria bacterium]|nr:N-acetylmuramoyl-L-alanine amidase [Alphaproteobacteria bacterium]MBR6684675.1 N-acetylmuramoyl-L-alanine amidase [Alphaproteobacteria bacterium]